MQDLEYTGDYLEYLLFWVLTPITLPPVGGGANEYLETVTIPDYDSENPTHFLITPSNNGFSQINNSAYNYFFVETGAYTPDVEITQSGTSGQKKYLTLYRTDDGTHPGQLTEVQNVNVEITFNSNVEHWVIDRISSYDADIWGDRMITINPGCKNIILNRLYISNFWEAITIYGDDSDLGSCTDNIVIQNCRIDTMSDVGFDADRSAIFLMGDTWDRAFTRVSNVKIIRNEIVNANDGIMPLKSSSQLADFQGLIINDNDIYITDAIYTDGAGNNDINGDYSQAENAIDIKAGSDNSENPVIITNNRIWGFRETDQNHSYSGSGSYGDGIVAHYFSKNLVIEDNIVFDCGTFLDISDSGSTSDPDYPGVSCSVYGASIKNNIFYDCKRNWWNLHLDEARETVFENNVIVHSTIQGNWFRGYDNEVNCNVNKNAIIAAGGFAGFDNAINFLSNYFYGCSENNSSYGNEYSNVNDANMTNYQFTTDKFTNNPRQITIPGVVSTENSPHWNDFN